MNFTLHHWYAATHHHNEDGIAEHNLRNQRFAVWAPKVKGMRVKSKRLGLVTVLEPACPGYILVGVAPGQVWEPILSTRGVSGLLMSGGRPIAASLTGLQDFAALFDASGIYDTTPKPIAKLRKGDEVRVTSGAYANWTGPVDEDQRGAFIKILLNIFGQPTITTVPVGHVARLESPETISALVR